MGGVVLGHRLSLVLQLVFVIRDPPWRTTHLGMPYQDRLRIGGHGICSLGFGSDTRARTPPTGLRWPSRRAAGALSHGDDIVPRLIGKKRIPQHGSLHQGASGPHTEHPALILITAQCSQQKSKDLQHAGLAKGNLVLSAGDGSIDGQPPTVTIPRSGHAFLGGALEPDAARSWTKVVTAISHHAVLGFSEVGPHPPGQADGPDKITVETRAPPT